MMQMIKVQPQQLGQLAQLACEIWHECFPGIISGGQIDYMIDRFQSQRAMERQISEEHYEYYFITAGGQTVGYTAIACQPGDTAMFLSKLYIRAELRGRGYASAVIDSICAMCRERGLTVVWLTVNRGNKRAIEVYLHKGFRIVREQCADIGNGYFMDDYVMELDIGPMQSAADK